MRGLTTILLILSLVNAAAFGGSNVFGLFRKRLMLLEHIQQQRETLAALKGFAGPHGEPLSGRDIHVDEEVRAPSEESHGGH